MDLCICVCVRVRVRLCLCVNMSVGSSVCVCMRCMYVLCVSCEQVSKIQTVFEWVANQPIKKKYQKPLNHLQC